MTRRLAPLVCLALAAVGASACDWTEFDDLQLQTPVRAVPRPDDMDSTLYPSFVLPVAKPRGRAELLVLGTDNVALADFTFESKGELGTQTVPNDRFLLNGAKVGPLAVAAYLPGSDDVPRIVAVTEEERQPVSITLDSTQANFAVTALGTPLAIEAGALAVGDARGTGETDVVITSGAQLLVMPNAAAASTQSCDLESAVSALAVGDGWVVAGQPAPPGNVWLVRPDYAPAPDGTCVAVTTLGEYVESLGFGTAVVVADIDGDGTREIGVSAPQERTVYFYSSGGSILPDPYGPKTWAGGSTACGNSIAVGVIEGARTLLVGDPGDPDVVGEAAAGAVWMLDLETGDMLPKLERPTTDVQRFGKQVGVVSFAGRNGTVELLWVTAEAVAQGDPGVVYLYYWVHHADTDPRAF